MGAGEQVVAGWILERRLGSGGYGEVWRARRRHVDLVRALKLIPIVHDAAFESWRHEIGRLEALNHPHVVRFYDADLVSEGPYRGYAWIATELCERSLADTLRARQDHLLPWSEGERLVEAMLAALAGAHAAGMVHRDIKPANILWHHSGTWKLCDFGTARLVPTNGTHPVTRVVGTSPYMSPAAHRGHQNQAADLYALGVTIHEALRGERLHRRPEGMSDGEYIKLVLDTPPTISTDLPRRWRTVVATLIGQHGELDAAHLATWFEETRGDRPPASRGVSPATRSATRPTTAVAARRMTLQPVRVTGPMAPRAKRGRRSRLGTGTATERTEIGVGARGESPAQLAPAPASPPPPRVHVPAPAPARASPPPAPVAPVPAGRSTPPNGTARPSSSPRGAGPAPPVAPAPRPAWSPQAADPTAVVGRRVVAALLDAVGVLALAAALYAATVVVAYDPVAIPPDASGPDEACEILGASYEACVTLGGDVYVSTEGAIAYPPFVLVAGLLVLVLLQGLSGATPGKLLVGLRVTGPGGRPPGVLRALLRTLLLVIDGLPWLVPLLGWLLARTTAHHRRLGDLVAGTFVVRRRALKPARPSSPRW